MPEITIREAISQALWEEMERDSRVIILGEEVGLWGGTYAVSRGFYDHFGPERVRETPIAEGVIVGAHFPGLKVVPPGTPRDAKGLLKAAIRTDDPVMFIEHATLYQTKGEVPEGDYVEPIGVAKVQRPGSDVTLITYSKMLQLSLQAADQLAAEGVQVGV